MSIPTLYGFLLDDALVLSKKVDTNQSYDQGYGVLTGESSAYLVNKAYLNDNRTARLSALEGYVPKGSMRIMFDSNQFADSAMIDALSDEDMRHLFNIIERVAYQGYLLDDDIEDQLVTEEQYTGYVPDTFTHSIHTAKVIATATTGQSVEYNFSDWYSFEFESGECHVDIKFWVNNRTFKTDYPFTTITRVIPPYALDKLINPTLLLTETNVEILTTGSTFIFEQTNLEAIARDQNGVYIYTTKYVIDNKRNIQLSFALPYCGPKTPTALECRDAIKDFIQSETGISDDDLELIFPELFIDSRFYITPLWDVYTSLTDRDVYNSVNSLKTITMKGDMVYTTHDPDFRYKYLELLLNAQNKMWCLSLPDTQNKETFSILEQHPTYQDYSSQMPGWRYMESVTQDFSGKLSRCLATLSGDAVSNEFTRVILDNRTYLTFNSGRSEYYVMDKATYLALVGA